MYIKYFIWYCLIILSCLYATNALNDDMLDEQLTLYVEDSLDDTASPSFQPRSTIFIRSVKSGLASISHTREWTLAQTDMLKSLAASNGLYRIRIRQEGDDIQYISTFTKACLMYESGLSEMISLMLGSNGNSVVGVSLFTKEAVCHGYDDAVIPSTINSTVIVRSPCGGPVPDTAAYIQKLDAIRMEKADPKDNRSFLSKYWFYIVPIVIVLFVAGGGQEQQSR